MAGASDRREPNQRLGQRCEHQVRQPLAVLAERQRVWQRGNYEIRKEQILFSNKRDGRREVPEEALQSSNERCEHEVQDCELQWELQNRWCAELEGLEVCSFPE